METEVENDEYEEKTMEEDGDSAASSETFSQMGMER